MTDDQGYPMMYKIAERIGQEYVWRGRILDRAAMQQKAQELCEVISHYPRDYVIIPATSEKLLDIMLYHLNQGGDVPCFSLSIHFSLAVSLRMKFVGKRWKSYKQNPGLKWITLLKRSGANRCFFLAFLDILIALFLRVSVQRHLFQCLNQQRRNRRDSIVAWNFIAGW